MLTSPLLTVHDAADILQVRESTVRVLIKDKRLRAVKIGKEWRIARRDLLAFLNENANVKPKNLIRQTPPIRHLQSARCY